MEEALPPGYDAIDADSNGPECMAALRCTEVRSQEMVLSARPDEELIASV